MLQPILFFKTPKHTSSILIAPNRNMFNKRKREGEEGEDSAHHGQKLSLPTLDQGLRDLQIDLTNLRNVYQLMFSESESAMRQQVDLLVQWQNETIHSIQRFRVPYERHFSALISQYQQQNRVSDLNYWTQIRNSHLNHWQREDLLLANLVQPNVNKFTQLINSTLNLIVEQLRKIKQLYIEAEQQLQHPNAFDRDMYHMILQLQQQQQQKYLDINSTIAARITEIEQHRHHVVETFLQQRAEIAELLRSETGNMVIIIGNHESINNDIGGSSGGALRFKKPRKRRSRRDTRKRRQRVF